MSLKNRIFSYFSFAHKDLGPVYSNAELFNWANLISEIGHGIHIPAKAYNRLRDMGKTYTLFPEPKTKLVYLGPYQLQKLLNFARAVTPWAYTSPMPLPEGKENFTRYEISYNRLEMNGYRSYPEMPFAGRSFHSPGISCPNCGQPKPQIPTGHFVKCHCSAILYHKHSNIICQIPTKKENQQ